MFKFSRQPEDAPQPQFANSEMPSATYLAKASNDLQVEMIRVAFKDTVRSTGVRWLDCEVRSVRNLDLTEQLQVHLVMKRWSAHLLRYSMAFQKQLQTCLDRYEPGVDHTGYEWIWRYSKVCDSPFPVMPTPEEWA